MPRARARLSQQSPASVKSEDDDGDDDHETTPARLSLSQYETNDDSMVVASQLVQNTQDIHAPKASDRAHLQALPEDERERVLQDLTRLILFKGLAGESIDRSKCAKEANLPPGIASAAMDVANQRLQNMFDFELKRIPAWMEHVRDMPKSKKERYYLVNAIEDDASGQHSKALHSVHVDSAVEKGLLMVVLALVYCQGEPKNDGSRWIRDDELYQLLHRLDENIPATPPEGNEPRTGQAHPNADAALRQFVQHDYLLKIKDKEQERHFYSLGPRAAIEVGRKQIILFCSDVLDQDPDPSMLHELQMDEEEEGEEEMVLG